MPGPFDIIEKLADPRRTGDRRKTRMLDKARILMARAGGFYPFFRTVEAATAREVRIDGEWKLVLGSNNYLGLTHHPKVLEAARDALERYGSGSTGSRVLNGTFDMHEELEGRLADFLGQEDAVVCSAGYLTNLATLSGVLTRGDHVFSDKLNHASLVDAVRLSLAGATRYPHADVGALARLLEAREGNGRALVVTDGVFSMDGSVPDLPRLVETAEAHGADVMVDDAHGLGVMGPDGRGTVHHFGLEGRVALVMGTFSKSLASIGGVVAGSSADCWEIRHRARPFIFTASMPPASLATTLAALDVLRSEPERRERLWSLSEMLREGLRELGYELGRSTTPVIPVYSSGGVTRLGRLWRALYRDGIFTQAVVPPAVPPDGIRLRLSLTAEHTPEDVERVVEAFGRHGGKLGLI